MRCHSVSSFFSPLVLSVHWNEVASDTLVIAAPSGMYLVSGSRPRLPTRMTLFTDAISALPTKQFAHAALVPLLRHDFEARDALAREHLGFAHAAHRGERFAQSLEIYSRCDGKRETCNPVDRRAHRGQRPHAQRRRQP